MTIVGMVPPVYYKGDLLVDGGYMNNIPVDVMRSMGVDTVRTWPAVHAKLHTWMGRFLCKCFTCKSCRRHSDAVRCRRQYHSLWSAGGASMTQPPYQGHGCILLPAMPIPHACK